MKIQRLLLKAFGPFTEVDLDLAGPEGTVNIVYGQNEAGKSSALRGLEGFCFGIPERSADDHVHRKDQMMVGATLQMANGSSSTFVRRKARKGTLVDASGTAITDELFEPFLCGVGKAGFEALFCLSYGRLSDGGKSIVEENGELGKLLFEARSDISLRNVQSTLSKRAEDLFKGTAKSSSTIDKALSELAALRKVLKKSDLVEYGEVQTRLSTVTSAKDALETERTELRLQNARLNRQLSAIPLVRRIKRGRISLAELGSLPELPPDFGREFLDANEQKNSAQSAVFHASGQVETLLAKLAEIKPNPSVLQWQIEIDSLNKQVEKIRGFIKDIPKQEHIAIEAISEARAVLARIRPGEEPLEANLAIDFGGSRISALGREKSRLEQALSGAQDSLSQTSRRLSEAKSALAETSVISISPQLVAAVRDAKRVEADETKLTAQAAEIKKILLSCEQRSSRLGADSRSLNDFVRLSVPLRSVIQGYVEDFLRLDNEIKTLQATLNDANKESKAVEAQQNRLLLSGNIPTESQLLASREERDESWKNLRSEITGRTAASPNDSQLDEFEKHIEVSDSLSDRLRREAERAAELASLTSRTIFLTQNSEATTVALEDARGRRQKLEQEWMNRWDAVGIRAEEPRQMIEWLDQFSQLSSDALRVEQLDAEMKGASARVEVAKSALTSALGRLDTGSSLADLIVDADVLITKAAQTSGAVETLHAQLKSDQDHLAAAKAQIAEINGNIADWQNQWLVETQCLRLQRVPTPEEADVALEAISKAAENLARARQAEKRVQGMNEEIDKLSGETSKVVDAAAASFKDLPPLDAIQNLYSVLNEAKRAEATQTAVQAQLETQKEALTKANREVQAAEVKLRSLCQRAGCDQPEELSGIVERHAEGVRVKSDLTAITNDLEMIAAGRPLEEFIDEVEPLDEHALKSQLEDIDTEIRRLNEELERVNQEIGTEKGNLLALDNGQTQIETQVKAEAALAKIRQNVRPYLVYAAAETLIKAQIEEFRRENQGPILKKASEIFAVLTDGSFSELTADIDDKDERVLIAVRRSSKTGAEERLKVEALSSATRIGLYLALRLACVYHHVDHREGLPFVADDILLDFDDARSRRVMEELGRLAEKTQVIIFTHHEHLVKIGKEVLGDRCLVQSLSH